MPGRKGPPYSANLYEIGAKKKGLDGNIWIITKTKIGIKRWIIYKKINKKTENKESAKDIDKNISWDITKPVSEIELFDRSNDNFKEVPKSYFESKLPIKKNDHVVLIYHNGEPLFTAPVYGSTRLSIFKSIEKGMNQRIDNNDRENVRKVYIMITYWFRSNARKELANKFESGKLLVKDLVGDHRWYENNLKRKNKIWQYGLGS